MKRFGKSVKAKLSNPSVLGQPEDQLRGPLEQLIRDLAAILIPRVQVTLIGEASIADMRTRPDYAVTVSNKLIGHIEIKAPGKGADPTQFKDRHDAGQWERLKALPNLIYTDGDSFSLWRHENNAKTVHLLGGIRDAGEQVEAPETLLELFQLFFDWDPIPPRDAKQLANDTARLCKLLRSEVNEQLALKNEELTGLARDWRKALFPDATDGEFADGYAQAVTFGLLMAKAEKLRLADGLDRVAKKLGNTLMGAALKILTDRVEEAGLSTSIETLTRVLDQVDWKTIAKGDPDAWLYFYEDFLAIYDNKLRKQTGSYYTPAEVVREMVRMVDEALRTRFGEMQGLASSKVTLVDPAVGTGTFLLGVLRRIAKTVEEDQGAGAVPAAINSAVRRLRAFEKQLGPFAVAQLRLLGELTGLIGAAPSSDPRMFVTDTLSSPWVEQEWLSQMMSPIAESVRRANEIKRHERIMVVLGNPPYKEKAKGRGGWVEEGDAGGDAPLLEWIPPADWKVGAHAKHLRNLYIYFWRWATWKIFDQDPATNTGIVCFITVAGFLSGPGFERMRDYLRRRADEIWIIDCSPEGHQPEVGTRIFEAVQQPICIVLASRSPKADANKPAKVWYRTLPKGSRFEKFDALKDVSLSEHTGWAMCSADWRSPFLPNATGEWSTYVSLEDIFIYSGSGVMPGRTWVIAPDIQSLNDRWHTLVNAAASKKEALFHPHLRGGEVGDKHSQKVCEKGLAGHESRQVPVASDHGECIPPTRYGFRSLDRQWLIPDSRLINQPNPRLWEMHSTRQLYLTALTRCAPKSGPAVTLTGHIPDLDHYKGSFGGRAFPLWLDEAATSPNIRPGLLRELSGAYRSTVQPEDVVAYVVAVSSHPAFLRRFKADLRNPGIRIPFTANALLFREAADLGRTVIWLETYGERFSNLSAGRPARPPRMSGDSAPRIPRGGAISLNDMPDDMRFDASRNRLYVGSGYVDGVAPEVWEYEISGKQVIRQWFSYRKKSRARPIMGDRRPPSELCRIQPDHWLPEYTSDLMDLLHVLGRLVELAPQQQDLLERICAGPILGAEQLRTAGAFTLPAEAPEKMRRPRRQNPAQEELNFSGSEQATLQANDNAQNMHGSRTEAAQRKGAVRGARGQRRQKSSERAAGNSRPSQPRHKVSRKAR